eukprot:TRINITY_DN24438_c0_g1_i4.p1 TRINITY_DN24438_c0_g1~~TRINITY_DN24438_c0_g1_i4.p1  ORF type:complete len:213 (+),score=72.04 TRINITY_DN24438_c0_g1_i4:55-639(+)
MLRSLVGSEMCIRDRYVLRGIESGMAGGSLNFPLHGAASNLTHRNFLEAQGLTPEGWARECNHGLVVPVKRGDGVLWYNHVYRAGKVGALDEGSFHGGCLVRRGEKWIANHWLEMSPPYEVRSLDDEIAAAMALLQSMKESLLDDGEVEDAVEVSRVVRLLSAERANSGEVQQVLTVAQLLIRRLSNSNTFGLD